MPRPAARPMARSAFGMDGTCGRPVQVPRQCRPRDESAVKVNAVRAAPPPGGLHPHHIDLPHPGI
eukprot:6291939-Prymnesium_polylepis.1